MKTSLHILQRLIISTATFLSLPAVAQWTTQTLALTPGWNAVYLEVQPVNDDADLVFAGMPVDSVWAWNASASSIQFIQDPNTLLPRQAEWFTYFPPNHSNAVVRNLFQIEGGRPYLINVKGAQPIQWTVTGKPMVKPIAWQPDSYNLVGFHVADATPPTLQNFFAASPAHVGQFVFKMNSSGGWDKVGNLATERISRGKAYWVRCSGASDYAGPLRITFEAGREVNFSRFLVENSLRLKNQSTNVSRTLTLRTLASAPVPSVGNPPLLAGSVPLSIWQFNTNNDFGFRAWTNNLSFTLAPSEELTLRIAVRRTDMTPFTPPAGRVAEYQSLIEVVDTAGTRILVPVSSLGIQATPSNGGGIRSASAGSAHPMAGLWVGSAAITNVNQPSHPSAPDALRQTRAEFPIRLLVHVDDSGTARLLKEVLLMWKNGTTKPDPSNPTLVVVDEPGRLVLATDVAHASQFEGSTLRDGQQVGRRISSVSFGFSVPVVATSQSGDLRSGAMSFDVATGYDAPNNPFRHKYHPDHDNLDERFEKSLPNGVESYDIQRSLLLTFSSTDLENLNQPGWGDTQIGGEYRESIRGVHKSTLYVGGKFRLNRVSDIAVLNDGQP